MKEDYCSFELSKLLKEKGFDEPCLMTYDIITHEMRTFSHCGNYGLISNLISCPTLQMAMKLIGAGLYGWHMTTCTEYDTKDEKELHKRCKIRATRLLITGFISLLLCCFIPSTKEMYAIYGIGGVIDYVKGNEKAKKLPDKVIDALDKYLDEQKGDEK